MKNKLKVIISLFTIIAIVVSSVIILNRKNVKNNNKLINIDSLSNEFVEEYLSEYKEITSKEDKKNMIIVVSNHGIKDSYGAKVIEAPNNQYMLQYKSEKDKDNALKKLRKDNYLSVEENHVYQVTDSNYNSWGIEATYLNQAITVSNNKELENVKVAVIDTGCDIALADKYYKYKIAEFFDVLEDSTSVMTDEDGHGTHVLGTVAEGTPDNVKIIPIKVSKDGSMMNSDIITAINYVTYYEKADVMNMSFGGKYYDKSMKIAIEAAKQKNIISVAAAGNDNTSANFYPSAFENTISIASVDSSLNKSNFSNYGSQVTFTAPGTAIKSIMNKDTIIARKTSNPGDDDEHVIISGTSMATPHAASAVAILKSYNKNLTLDNTIELLKKHSIDLGDEGWDIYYGYGMISFKGAQLCDGEACDEYGVFKEGTSLEVTNIEIPYVSLTSYNYYSKNNLFNTPIKVYYSDTEFETKTLGELDKKGLEIVGYDPCKKQEQEIQIKYEGFTLNETVPYPDNYISGWEYSVIDDNSIELTLYKGNTNTFETLYIPEKIDGYNVVSLAGNTNLLSKVFASAGDYSSFQEIVLPKTLTNIGRASLSGGKFKKVTSLADSVSVGEYAFANSTSLKKFNGLISSIESNAFMNNTSIDDIRLTDDITSIPSGAFKSCTNLSHISLPSNITSIGDYAFEMDYKLTSIVLPEGLKKIGRNAFLSTNIADISFPESLESIGRESFYNSNIRNLVIPKNLTSIGEDAFTKCESLESIYVDPDNDTYFSGSFNALIDTNSMTLLKGIASTEIINGIKKIAPNAFSYDLRLEEITIPSTVTEIGDYAFYNCNYLKNVKIERSVQNIGDYAFENNPAEEPIKFLTYTDAYAKTYAVDNEINYDTMDPSYILVNTNKTNYKAFDKVNINDDISAVKLYYDYGYNNGIEYKERKGLLGKEEIINDYSILYPDNRESFRYEDEYYTVKGTNSFDIDYEKQVGVTVDKATPKYTVPTNIKANLGDKLSDIELSNGFSWMNPNEVLEEVGDIVFKAKYTPSDTTNYEIVENIDITVSVINSKTIITPEINIKNKIYDGTININKSDINISNLDSDEYTVISAISTTVDAGDTNALVKIKLTDNKFKNYSFEDGKQEKEFTVNLKIEPLKIEKPTKPDGYYTYIGEEITFTILNFDEDKMNVVNNKGTNAGTYTTVISLKSNNYVWSDSTNNNIELTYEIKKANLIYTDNSSDVTVKYDGNSHTININIEKEADTTLRYMDSEGNYTLTEIPSFKEIGEYVIKYRLYKNENYQDYKGEKTLTITANSTILNNSTDYEGMYDGEYHTININIEPSDYTIKYSIDNTNYNLDELPKFKNVGVYTINYKISKEGYDDLEGSNKVKIYGIKKFDDSITLQDNTLVVSDNSFYSISNNITTYSTSTTYSHYNKDNEIEESDEIKTGDIIKISINNVIYEYKIAYLGDTSGDGIINYLDYVNVYNHIQKVKNPESNKKLLTDEYLLAADMSKDNNINYLDYVIIYNKIKELKGDH